MTGQSGLPVRHRGEATGQAGYTVHLVVTPCTCKVGEISAVCGELLFVDDIGPADPGEDVTCPACVAQAPATRPADAESPTNSCNAVSAEQTGVRFDDYDLWGWPVTRRGDLVQLMTDGDASAIAIPIPLSVKVTRILIARHCAPAVMAHPYASEHHMVLTGERFGALLPWPPGVYQVNCSLMLPPTKTLCGPITWVQPPSRDSLRLSREIDVFAALRTALNG